MSAENLPQAWRVEYIERDLQTLGCHKDRQVDKDRPGNTTNCTQNGEFTKNELCCSFACTVSVVLAPNLLKVYAD